METVSYGKTKIACYLGYITQAISINLLPMLYVTFQNEFSVSFSQLGLLATVIFVVQILVDLLAARFAGLLSYRVGCVVAHVLATAGLVLMSCLPSVLPNPYVGILISTVLLSVGGGLTEVLISPVVDAVPGKSKAGEMSLLHSFYCWGVAGVALLSTIYFTAFGAVAWRWLTLLWALVPAITTVLFIVVPLPDKPEESVVEKNTPSLMCRGLFWLFMALMLFSGASEMGMAQWASLFAERGLRISKATGDLLGMCAFAVLQGTSRVVYARLTLCRDPRRLLAVYAVGCAISYGVVAVSPWPTVSLLGFCFCGWFVGPMWPGLLSLSSSCFPAGGTEMFALLALCGDIGCAAAPALVGSVSDGLQYGGMAVADALRGGFGICAVFPVLLVVGLVLLRGRKHIF